jgi:hypothetical protein
MKEFLEDHFNVLFLGLLAILGWVGTIHLMHSPGMAAENVSWARETAGGIIYALVGLMTGYTVGKASKDKNPPDDKKGES